MNTVDLNFEHKGRALITQRSRWHGNVTHSGRAVTIHATRPYGQYELVLLFAYTDNVFNAKAECGIAGDGQKYVEVCKPAGTRLFDSRDMIPCDFTPAPKRLIPQDYEGKRLHPRHFREQRNQ
jgi:hypothetical protein